MFKLDVRVEQGKTDFLSQCAILSFIFTGSDAKCFVGKIKTEFFLFFLNTVMHKDWVDYSHETFKVSTYFYKKKMIILLVGAQFSLNLAHKHVIFNCLDVNV